MSATRKVPAALPLLSHSSDPWVPSLAEKNRVPLTFTREPGDESPAPGLMSFTRKVPAAPPLLSHSSIPWVPSLA
jgi:hypothetical protein